MSSRQRYRTNSIDSFAQIPIIRLVFIFIIQKTYYDAVGILPNPNSIFEANVGKLSKTIGLVLIFLFYFVVAIWNFLTAGTD